MTARDLQLIIGAAILAAGLCGAMRNFWGVLLAVGAVVIIEGATAP